MNPRDQANFEFIMSLTPDQLQTFFSQRSDDDIQYAIELVRRVRSEVELKNQEILDREEMDLSEARAVLARIMAK